jgi:hypothetical protein
MMLHAVLAWPFAPAEQRAELVAGRLAAIPDARRRRGRRWSAARAFT